MPFRWKLGLELGLELKIGSGEFENLHLHLLRYDMRLMYIIYTPNLRPRITLS